MSAMVADRQATMSPRDRPRAMGLPLARGCVAPGDPFDRFWRDAESAQAEPERTFANFGAVKMMCCPRLLSARPHHAVYRFRRGRRDDVLEAPSSRPRCSCSMSGSRIAWYADETISGEENAFDWAPSRG